jgi:hypothetical protein
MTFGFGTHGSKTSLKANLHAEAYLSMGSRNLLFLKKLTLFAALLATSSGLVAGLPSLSEAAPQAHYIDGRPAYPVTPEEDMTSGDLCSQPSAYRYPERIAYCERDVHTSLKREIIAEYDQTKGYRIGTMNREDFKIDHLIPLCMGGSNSKKNLWPQHRTVFELTDDLEFQLCQKMAAGRLNQQEAVQMILRAKRDLDSVPTIRSQLTVL